MINNKIASIIIRTQAKSMAFLDKAIYSIYCNHYEFKEVIVVYQGLDAGMVKKIENLFIFYPGLSFKVLMNETNADKRAQNLNIGIGNATGRYISFLDDDDELYPDFLSELINGINISGLGWAHCNHKVISVKNNYFSHSDAPLTFNKYSYIRLLLLDAHITINCFIIDRTIVKEEFIKFDEDLRIGEDYFFLLQLGSTYRPYYVNRILCHYVKHDKGTIINLSSGDSQIHKKILERKKNIVKDDTRLSLFLQQNRFKIFLYKLFCVYPYYFIIRLNNIAYYSGYMKYSYRVIIKKIIKILFGRVIRGIIYIWKKIENQLAFY